MILKLLHRKLSFQLTEYRQRRCGETSDQKQMTSLSLRSICVIQLSVWCIGIGAWRVPKSQQHVAINPDAIVFPEADSSLSNLPFLHVINLNIKDKVQSMKTPIQRSSEAFALDLIRVSPMIYFYHELKFH